MRDRCKGSHLYGQAVKKNNMVSGDKDNAIFEDKSKLILHDVRDNSPSPSSDPYICKIKNIGLRAGMEKC